MRDIRTLVVGLLLGACLVLSMGQARAVNAQRGRYLVTPSIDANGNYVFFVHDLETDKVQRRVLGNTELPHEGLAVESILQKN